MPEETMYLNKIAEGAYGVETARGVLVADEAARDRLTGLHPGSLAYTAGFKKMWMLDTDGATWVSVL